ncbi:hypothetical protein LOK49_LG02G00215 [Camellia lanceoleosa]|uniref:Uncharacterized protein n=1 Tax=Camellia lanceoleosa TaxID=1840588 RepID=A0ACC0INQ8_9ERIC|nr:hypothetical protein LOK49_LG02G00215 [Camellia lanceoleosa]
MRSYVVHPLANRSDWSRDHKQSWYQRPGGSISCAQVAMVLFPPGKGQIQITTVLFPPGKGQIQITTVLFPPGKGQIQITTVLFPPGKGQIHGIISPG